MHGKLGLLSRGKASSHSTALPQLSTPRCAVFLCFHTIGCEAYSVTTDEYAIFNVRTNLGACRHHKGGSGTNTSAQELTRMDRKPVSHSASPVDRTQGLPI